MPRINLLPWRAEQRRERKVHLAIAIGAATAVAVALAGGIYLMLGSMVSSQQARNDRLRLEIKHLDKQIEEINNLEVDKQNFIARMEIIEKLQRSRPEIVHLFDTIVHVMPDGTYLTSLAQTERKIKFEGVAQSSTRVSALMRNIDSSEWLKNPELEVIDTGKSAAAGSTFKMSADQVTHVESDDTTKPGSKGAPNRTLNRVTANNGGAP